MKLWELFADKVLDIDLFEMAYQRKVALGMIYDLGLELAEHMIKLEHCAGAQCVPHWKTEIDGWFKKIYRCVNNVKTKKAQLQRSAIIEAVWEGPLGEYKDYLALYASVLEDDEAGLKFSEPSEEAWLSIKSKLMKAIDLMIQKKVPGYDKL